MSEQTTAGDVWFPAPYQGGPMHTGQIQGVWAHPDTDVEWVWSHTPGGSYISGYTLRSKDIPVPKDEEDKK